MPSKVAALLIDPLSVNQPVAVAVALTRSGIGGWSAGRPSARHRWTSEAPDAIYPAAVAAICPAITNSAGTSWDSFPADRDFG